MKSYCLYKFHFPSNILQLRKFASSLQYLFFNILSSIILTQTLTSSILGFPGGSDGKESAYNAEDMGSIPELGRSPGEGNSNPLQYSCLENTMDRGAGWATVHGVTKSRTRLSD